MKLNLPLIREYLWTLVLALVVLALIVAGGFGIWWWQAQRPVSCNVASITLYGALAYYPNEGGNSSGTADQTAAEDIRQQIEAADADPGIQAILL